MSERRGLLPWHQRRLIAEADDFLGGASRPSERRMFLRKLVGGSRPLLRRSAAPLQKGARSCSAHVVAIPPRDKVSGGELAVMGIMLFASLWFTPFWVLYHLPDYQKEDRKQYTGK